jgi:hypothetical protein
VRQVLSLALAALALTCTSPASPCGTGPAPDLFGPWQYEGTQESPITATLSGTLTIDSQSGQTFGGTLDVTETGNGSAPRQLSGWVTGCALDASVDFDALFTVETAARRHLGTVSGDSITKGSWVEFGPSGQPVASGTFKSARSGP